MEASTSFSNTFLNGWKSTGNLELAKQCNSKEQVLDMLCSRSNMLGACESLLSWVHLTRSFLVLYTYTYFHACGTVGNREISLRTMTTSDTLKPRLENTLAESRVSSLDGKWPHTIWGYFSIYFSWNCTFSISRRRKPSTQYDTSLMRCWRTDFSDDWMPFPIVSTLRRFVLMSS